MRACKLVTDAENWNYIFLTLVDSHEGQRTFFPIPRNLVPQSAHLYWVPNSPESMSMLVEESTKHMVSPRYTE